MRVNAAKRGGIELINRFSTKLLEVECRRITFESD